MDNFKEKFLNKIFLIRLIIFLFVVVGIVFYIYFPTFKEVINLILTSFLFAYILRPLRDLVKGRRNISKRKSTIIVISFMTFLLIMLFFIGLPILIKELGNTGSILDETINYLKELVEKLHIKDSSVFKTLYFQIEDKIWNYIMNLSEGVIRGIGTFLENILSLVIVPIISYYILSDGDNISNKLFLFIPMEKRKIVKIIGKDINLLLERYIISQLFLSFATGVMCFVAFWILDLKFTFWLAIINGIFNVIPYFGAFFGGIPAVLIGFLDSPSKGIWSIIFIIIIQQIEGNILAPKLTAESTNIHPLVIILLLLLGEKIGGVIGMILIVPIGVILKVIYDDINYYLF